MLENILNLNLYGMVNLCEIDDCFLGDLYVKLASTRINNDSEKVLENLKLYLHLSNEENRPRS